VTPSVEVVSTVSTVDIDFTLRVFAISPFVLDSGRPQAPTENTPVLRLERTHDNDEPNDADGRIA